MTASLLSRFTTDHDAGDNRRYGTAIEPAMACSILYETVTGLQMGRNTVVQFHRHFTRQHDFEIDGVGRMHAGRISLKQSFEPAT